MFALAALVVTIILHFTGQLGFPLVAVFYLIEAELLFGSVLSMPWKRGG